MKQNVRKIVFVGIATLGLVAIGGSQIKQVIKILGVGVAVSQFGPQIDKQFDKLTNHTDTDENYTKVVPIIGIGIGAKSAIGAAQIKGARVNVDKVKAVASPEIELFGKEIRLRAMIPVATDKVATKGDIKAVDGVGVSGIVDLKL